MTAYTDDQLLKHIADSRSFNDWCGGWNATQIARLQSEGLINVKGYRGAFTGDADGATATLTPKGRERVNNPLSSVKFTVEITTECDPERGDHLAVTAFARGLGLDRPRVHGWTLDKDSFQLAGRLAAAIVAGAVLHPEEIKRDERGSRYLDTRCSVLGRTLNADLQRLGF